VIMLKNGGLLRGTIGELIPDDTVTIVTVSGGTRRISMTEVSYAGPAAKAPDPSEAAQPEPPKPKPTSPKRQAPRLSFAPSADEVPFSFVSRDEKDLTLYVKTDGFTRLCTAPCDGVLPAGAQQLALGLGSQRPVRLSELTRLQGPSILRGSYESHKSTRTTGWAVFGVSLGLGNILFLGSAYTAATREDCGATITCDRSVPMFAWASLVAGLAGAALGLGLALNFDEVDLRVTQQ
jgi:hypothetical protein